MDYYEFGGGLGDVINAIFLDGGYRCLEHLPQVGPARVVVASHNPGAGELFRWHRHRHLLQLEEPGYWAPEDDARRRRELRLPPPPPGRGAPPFTPVRFYPSPEDEAVLRDLPERFVLLAASAGLPGRDLPEQVALKMMMPWLESRVPIVQVGRDYPRCDRPPERRYTGYALDLVNRLTAPGVLVALQRSMGLFTCHSALCIAGWHLRKPMRLAYPPEVREAHFRREDLWSFGASRPETQHGTFDQWLDGEVPGAR